MIMDIGSFRERRLLETVPHEVVVAQIRGCMGKRYFKNNEVKLKSVPW